LLSTAPSEVWGSAFSIAEQGAKVALVGRTQSKLDDAAAAIRAAGGVPVLNHPNFTWAITADDMKKIKNLALFEALRNRGYGEADLRAIASENLVRVLRRTLPD
jgi:NAD(P)-dependent dehydrogenase (short-subunit alcohol dehydrogenase family)